MFLDDWKEEANETHKYDEALQNSWEECARLSKEWEKQRDRKRTAEAIAQGFSCKEDLDEHEMELSRQLQGGYERQLEDKAALLGKAVDEIYAEDPQRFSPRGILGPLSSCDCYDHPIPTFCADSLVEYRSMDAPDLIGYLDGKHRLQTEELNINENDGSKRLDAQMLDRYWDRESQDEPLELLPWFRKDEVLKQILLSTRLSRPVSLDKSYPCTPNSIFTEDHVEISDDNTTAPTSLGTESDLQPSTRIYESQKDGIEGTQRRQISSRDTSPSIRMSIGGKHRQKLKNSAVPPPKQTKMPRGIRKLGKTSIIRKRALLPAMQTRSRKVTKFYKLSDDGVVMSYRRF